MNNENDVWDPRLETKESTKTSNTVTEVQTQMVQQILRLKIYNCNTW